MKITKIDQAQNDLRALKELRDSRGWQVVMESANADILNAALQMADNPTMTEKEIDFRRGAIWATRNFVSAVDLLILKTENDLLTAFAEQQTQQQTQTTNLDATA